MARGIRFVGALALISGLAAVGAWASDGGCITIRVEDPVRLPDGSLHPSGQLTLCESVTLSPVSTLHRTFINGRPYGMLRSRRSNSEGGADLAPVVLFQRRLEGDLELFGYTLPGRGSSVTYLFGDRTRISPRMAGTRRGGGAPPGVEKPALPSQTPNGTVVVAAAASD